METKAYVLKQIEDRRGKLQKLERDRLTLAAEIRAYEDMLQHLEEQGHGGDSESAAPTRHRPSESVEGAVAALSPGWRKLLATLALAMDDEFTTADVLSTAHELSVPTTDVNVRSQLSIYTGKGIVERLGGGRYRMSDRAAEALRGARPPAKEKSLGQELDDEIPF